MGIPGLWDLIRHTGKTQALAQLALQGFRRDTALDPLQETLGLPDDTPHPRALRIGIDASIWFFHAAYGREGENPELRTLFFRLAKLASFTFCPLFVFDGPQRPKTKRGKTINTRMNSLAPGMKNMIAAFGFEWRTAPGEAEAELAYLNHIGVIDAVLSDDVDNFLFGAKVVIRNPSGTLSGNRSNPVLNSQGKDDGMHVKVYRAADIEKDPACRLTRGGMILIGLLSGGDYDQGAKRCGPKTALSLAQCGLGDELLGAFQTLSPERFADYIPAWKAAVVDALRSGCAGLGDEDEGEAEDEDEGEESQETAITASQCSARSISGSQQKGKSSKKAKPKKTRARRQPALAAEIAASDFPDLDVLREYCAPWTSERAFASAGPTAGPSGTDVDDVDYPSASQGSVITASQTSTTSTKSKKKKKGPMALTVNSVGSGGLTSNVRIGWTGELALGALGRICEQYFEWGVREIIQLRFRTVLWPAVVLRVLRRSIMEAERARIRASRTPTTRPTTPTRSGAKRTVPGTPRRLVKRHFGGGSGSDSGSGSDTDAGSRHVGTTRGGDETPRAKRTITAEGEQLDPHQLLQAVRGERQHVSTDELREFRVEVAPAQLARLAVRELLGTRDPALLAGTLFDMEPAKGGDDDEEDAGGEDEEGVVRRLKMVDSAAPVRVWVPAELVQAVHPELVRAWEERGTKSKSRAKPAGSASTSRRKAPGTSAKDKEGDGTAKKGGPSTKAKAKAKEKEKERPRHVPTTLSGDEIEEEVPPPRIAPLDPPAPKPSSASRPASHTTSGTTKPSVSGSSTLKTSRPKPSTSKSLETIPERSSSPSLIPDRSSSPPLVPPPAPRRPIKRATTPTPVLPPAPRRVPVRIPGVVDVPSPPRRAIARDPANESSELEDMSFRALLTRPKKHTAPEPDSDSEGDAGGKGKSSRRSRAQPSPRASSSSEVDVLPTKKPVVVRKPSATKAAVPSRRPSTRSQSSSGLSEVEILDTTVVVRPLKHKAPEPSTDIGRDAEGTGKVRRRSYDHVSPRSSASENERGEGGSDRARSKSTGKRVAVPAAGPSRPRAKPKAATGSRAGTSSVPTKTVLARAAAADTTIELMSSSDDGCMILPSSLTEVSVRLDAATDRVTQRKEMTRLDDVAAYIPQDRESSPIEVANTSVIDLISD
ncbi:hypothetical protein BDV93DRAFT_512787 [Ceratobasidium sp. AG-I]|nr:hypothetical protein BDV93DRAFT_512787 [Ceratobasidium sp. AG-I]